MQIQISTDHTFARHEALMTHVTTSVKSALRRFSKPITRVEVHLTDENAKSGAHDKRCVMEARFEGRQPIAVTDHAGTLDQAMLGAVHKLTHPVKSTPGRAEYSNPRRWPGTAQVNSPRSRLSDDQA